MHSNMTRERLACECELVGGRHCNVFKGCVSVSKILVVGTVTLGKMDIQYTRRQFILLMEVIYILYILFCKLKKNILKTNC